ncbi:MAG: riboflavin synthase [Planctomycetaceae bacterium]
MLEPTAINKVETMFTGLIEARGSVAGIQQADHGIRLAVNAPSDIADGTAEIGDSIAINGCCLTIVEIKDAAWTFEAGEETLSKTNLGDLVVESPVNLERALPANGRLGGHFVQGHVDGVGVVDEIKQDGEWTDMYFRLPPELAAQLVPKGSVAVDGISLTVVTTSENRFNVALIPHTLDVTTLGARQVGDRVNIETDILGKYVRQFMNQ